MAGGVAATNTSLNSGSKTVTEAAIKDGSMAALAIAVLTPRPVLLI